MGMLGHAIEIMIVAKDNNPLILDFWLDNEEYLYLSKKKDLFLGVLSTAELLERIPKGFMHPKYRDLNLRDFVEAFDFEEDYAEFEEDAGNIPLHLIDSVVLMSTMNQEYGEHEYTYEWIKYSLSSNKIITGTGFGKTAWDAERYIKTLASVAEGQEVKSAPVVPAATAYSATRKVEAPCVNVQKLEEDWIRAYGSVIVENPRIIFEGKSFVLSGMSALSGEYQISIEEEIVSRGGVVRKSVSGKTDYLVVDPRLAGESKVKNAIEQQNKGKPVKVILGTDLIAAIQLPVPTEKVEKTTPCATVPQNEKVSVQNEIKPEPTALSDFVIEGTCLEKYIGLQRNVVIPEGITEIGNWAFNDCGYLESVIFPDTLRKIGEYAFSDCGALKSVILPFQIESLGENAFNNCSGIYEISIPGTIKHIPEWLCSGCNKLVKVFIEEGVQTIANYAFNGDADKDVFLPASVAHVEKYAFSYGDILHVPKGSSAERYCIDNNKKYDNCLNDMPISVDEDWLVVGDQGKFYLGAGGDVVVPASVKNISDGCFGEARDAITSVLISEGVKVIEEESMSRMAELKHLILPKSLSCIELYSMIRNPQLEEILIPNGVQYIGDGAFSNNPSLKNIYIPASVTEMDNEVFDGLNPDCTIYVEEGSYAEAYCKENDLHYEYGVLSEEQYQAAVTAFLQSAQTEQKVQKTTEDLQRKCEYRIKDGTTVTGFSGNAIDFVIPEGIEEIGVQAFYGCEQMQSVKLPPTLRSMGTHAFAECRLKSLALPSTVQEIGSFAFSECSELESISFEGEPISVGHYAFSGCSKLCTVEFSDEMKVIEEAMFNDCKMLNNIHLPEKLREIRASAFCGCESLLQIVIPVGVTKIAEKAFSFCENLKDIHITPFIKEIGEDAFSYISEDAVFHVIKGTYAERYCQEHGFTYDYKLDQDLLGKVQSIVHARKQQVEKKRREEEMKAEQERQRILAAQRARYTEIEQAISLQLKIIGQNKGWFGEQARARKAAQEQLAHLQGQLAKEFPQGKP